MSITTPSYYLQDNWKVNNRPDARYGCASRASSRSTISSCRCRTSSERVVARAAPLLTCRAATTARRCFGNARNAVDPRTGQILTAPGAANTAAAIGTVVPAVEPDQRRPQGRRRTRTRRMWPLLAAAPALAWPTICRHADLRTARSAAASSTIGRTATPFSRSRQPADLDVQDLATANCRRSHGLSTIGCGMIDFHVRRKAAFVMAVEAGSRPRCWAMALDSLLRRHHGFTGCARSRAATGGSVD